MLLPKEILRSVIRFNDENEEHLSSNLYMLRQEVDPQSIDSTIIEFIGDIFDRTKAIPSVSLIAQAFKDKNNETALTRLSELVGLESLPVKLLYGPEYRYALDSFKSKLAHDEASQMILEASQILNGGLRRGGVAVQGADAAINHLVGKIAGLNQALKRGSIEGSFRKDASAIRRQYEHWKNNPQDTVGVLTGIDKIDVVHRGVRPGELILVMGFVSHLKTTFCFNWLYKAAILFGRNVAIASLETSVDDLRLMFYVLHSSHQKFVDVGLPSLDFEKVSAGVLSPEEENTLDRVIEDLKDNPDYGEVFYKEPQDALTVHEIQRWAESKHKSTPLDMLVIDYVNLVDAGKGVSSFDSTANLNKVIRQSKMMAMTFGQGRGIPVVSPFQANREGLKDAEKNNGHYKLTALANANESERSTDKVYYVYLDDVLRNSRELVVGNLKNRRGPVILEQFKVLANPANRLIDNLDQSGAATADLVEL